MSFYNVNDIGMKCGCSACAAMSNGDYSILKESITELPGIASAERGEDLLVEQWPTTSLNYKFLTSLPFYYSPFSQESNNLQAFTASMQNATEEILGDISEFTNLRFTETDNEYQGNTLTFAQARLPETVSAWAYLPTDIPNVSLHSGDVWTNNRFSYTKDMTKGGYGYLTLMHEIGHALGLQHSFSVYNGEEASSIYSVMSYDWSPYFSTSYMVYDIAALQAAYGANMTYRIGDDIYSLSSDSAYSIWDAGGVDKLDASSQGTDVTLDLREGGYSTVGLYKNIGIAYGAIIENAESGDGDDTLIGNDADNILIGNAGDDTFFGGDGNDTIDGGAGDDRADYYYTLDTYEVSFIDTISFVISNTINGAVDFLSSIETVSFDNITYDVFGDGNDTLETLFALRGTSNDDVLEGGGFSQSIYGLDGNDTLIGNEGDDILYGGLGDDVYLYHLGDGADVIEDDGGLDTLHFVSGFNAGNIVQAQIGNDLEISFTNSATDQITIKNYYSASNEVEAFVYGLDVFSGDAHSIQYVGGDLLQADGGLNNSTQDAIPVITNNNVTSEGVFSSSGTTYSTRPDWNVVDGNAGGDAWSSNNSMTWVAFDFNEAKIINKYMVSSRGDYFNHAVTAPKDWVFEASNDGDTWTILDSVTGEGGWGLGEARYFDFNNDTAFNEYRISFTANNGGPYYSIGEVDFIEAQGGEASQKLFNGFELNDGKDVVIDSVEIRLSNATDGIANEVISTSPYAGITSTYAEDGATGDFVYTLNGSASVEIYEGLLQQTSYINTAGSRSDGLRNVAVTVTDSSGNESDYNVELLIGADPSAQALSEVTYIARPAGMVATIEADGALNDSTQDAIPNVTNNNVTSEGVFSSSGTTYSTRPDWNVVDGNAGGDAWSSNNTVTWAAFSFNEAKVINKYLVASRGDYFNHAVTAPKDWVFEASNDGNNWTVLDNVSGESGWGSGEARYFDFVNDTAFNEYRISFTANNGGPYYSIGEIDFIETVATVQPNKVDVFNDLTLGSAPDDVINGATIRLVKGDYSIEEEVLSVELQGNVSAEYTKQGEYYVLNLTGADTVSVYEDILQSINYQNTADSLTGERELEVVLYDEANSFAESYVRTVDLISAEIQGTSASDTLIGNEGDDILYGGLGDDVFVFDATNAFEGIDVIIDFSSAEGDKLDISDIISGGFSGDILDYLQFSEDGDDTLVLIDADGAASGASFEALATIADVTGLDEASFYANGDVIV